MTAQLVTDLITGVVPLAFQNITNVLGQLQSGDLRPLASASKTRSVTLPNVPTAAEAGLVTTRNLISIGAEARASVIEAYLTLPGAAAGQSNVLSELSLGAGAQLSQSDTARMSMLACQNTGTDRLNRLISRTA